jgi:N-methylhydantoinase A
VNDGAREYFLAVDIGGTFTDIIVARDDGLMHRAKVLSTFDDLLQGIGAGLTDLLADSGVPADRILQIAHASTVGTNTILEHKGAVTGLLTTEGFRDVLEIARLRRPSLYDVFWEKPPPLVRRSLRREVHERVAPDGTIEVPLDASALDGEIDRLTGAGVESIAVCLLHSYANPDHELSVREAIQRRHPGMRVSLSHEILPELREYERTSTTVINAYILAAVDEYLGRFGAALEALGMTAPVFMMQSNGGTIPAERARARPVSIVESGPAAGALATGFMAARAALPNVIAFDMGGTTAKACVIQDGAPEMAFEYEVGAGINAASPLLRGGGYALRGPTIAIAEVGSGGGSIAWVDEGGALQVGPRSAGADPGPACYGRGGSAPTVTDANVILGYINATNIAGGRLRIDRALAEAAIDEHVARPLGLSVAEAARGVHAIAIENMARAVRAVTTERGRDPREFALVAFGGSGPVHAAGLARAAGMERVVVPIAAGVFSALGLLFSDVRHDFVSSVMAHLDAVDDAALRGAFERLVDQSRGESVLDGAQVQYLADVRYVGQSFELTVDLGDLSGDLVARTGEAFVSDYARLYGQPGTGAVEVVNLRVAVTAPMRRVPYERLASINAAARNGAAAATRPVVFDAAVGSVDTTVVAGRQHLPAEGVVGPTVIEEPDTTILVPPGCQARRDGMWNVVVEVS